MNEVDGDSGMNRPDRAVGRQARRLAREERTLMVMVAMYCRDHHANVGPSHAGELCSECAALAGYARRRLDACRYGAGKPACADCPTHCYAPAMREQVRAVMRYAGPRMIREHPLLAVAHLAACRRSVRGGE
jgi:hypothetical protein